MNSKNKNRLKMREYHHQNKERRNLYDKKYRLKNKEKIKIYDQEKRDKEKGRIRTLTRRKYGKPPENMQYHHTTTPYNLDKWIIMDVEDHCKIHQIKIK